MYPYSAFAFLGPAELLMFGSVAPTTAALMWCVDAPYRSLAVARMWRMCAVNYILRGKGD